MKCIKVFASALFFFLTSALIVSAVPTHRIMSTRAADDDIKGWERQSYPIGNGWFGVNVFGGVECERDPEFLGLTRGGRLWYFPYHARKGVS